jgi:hypothetical protein
MKNERQVSEKLPYEAPSLTVRGTLEGITESNTGGAHFDQSFQQGDPIPPNFTS